MAYYMAGEGRRLFGQTTPSELRDKFNMSVRMPIGVVGVITPWNFPIAIPSWKITPALVCGNTVVFKPATDTPLLGAAFRRAARRGGPAARRRQHRARRRRRGRQRARRHPDVPVISLTGSRETGVEVTRTAADRLKHVHLELGGKNAIIVLDDANLDLAVDGIIWSAFGTSGQRCTAATPRDRRTRRRLRGACVPARRRGREDAPRVRLGGRDRRRAGDQQDRPRQDPLVHGDRQGRGRDAPHRRRGRVRERPRATASSTGRPIFGDVDPQMRIAQEEIFGPTTAVIRVRDADEAIESSNGIKYGLSSSIFTQDVNRAFRAMRDLRPGSCTSTRARSAPRCTCRSAASRTRATATARRGRPRSTSSRSGSRSTSTLSGKLQKAQIDTEI